MKRFNCVETTAMLVCEQISSDSFKNEITLKLYVQINDWCSIVTVI